MDNAPFDALLDRYQSGEATGEELGELDRQLRADVAKRRMLVERALLEVQLRKFFRGLAPMSQTLPQQPLPPAAAGWWLLVVAGLIVTVVVLWLLITMRNARGPGAAVESGVVRVNDVVTAIVPAGVPFEVAGQIPAVLRLPDGADAELDRGTRATLLGVSASGGRRIDVAHGGGKFAVATGQAPLHVETSAGTVIAKSAQFTARLGKAADGQAALTVTVSAGTVEVAADGQRETLTAGQQRVFAAPADP